VILAERQADTDDVPVMQGTEGQSVTELVLGDELDGLGFVEPEGRKLLFQVKFKKVTALILNLEIMLL